MKTETQAYQKCININCGAEYDCCQVYFKCPKCGDLLDVKYNWDKIQLPQKLSDFANRWSTRSNRLDFSGVWRFRELLDFCDDAGQDKDRQIKAMEAASHHFTRNDWRSVAGFDDLGEDGEVYVMQASQVEVRQGEEIPEPAGEPEPPEDEPAEEIQEVDEKKKP